MNQIFEIRSNFRNSSIETYLFRIPMNDIDCLLVLSSILRSLEQIVVVEPWPHQSIQEQFAQPESINCSLSEFKCNK